jgi:hypothetical protein
VCAKSNHTLVSWSITGSRGKQIEEGCQG